MMRRHSDQAKEVATIEPTARRDRRPGLTRRRFVTASSLVVGGAAVLPLEAASAFAAAAPSHLSHLGFRRFQAVRGNRFSVKGSRVRATLELISVKDQPEHTAPGGECYTLRFRKLSGSDMCQGTYSFSNSTLGSFRLFLVPGKSGESFSAIINRLG